MPEQPDGIDWLSVDQAAAYLGVTRRAVHKYVQTGKLPAFKTPVGGRTLFKRADLDVFKTPQSIRPGALLEG